MKDDFLLGRLLGRREAFATIAGRCTAAEAAQLKEMRDRKLYLSQAPTWKEFCRRELKVSDDVVAKLIRSLEEFGPTYFDIAQFTRISPATYRALAPSIRDQAIHHNGEAIALIPENADKVAAAVAEMRKTVTVKAVAVDPPSRQPASVEREAAELGATIEAAVARRTSRMEARRLLLHLRDVLCGIEQTL